MARWPPSISLVDGLDPSAAEDAARSQVECRGQRCSSRLGQQFRVNSGGCATDTTPLRTYFFVIGCALVGIGDVEPIGSDCSSRVYQAVQTQFGRVVAGKVLTGTDPVEQKQFDLESRALGRLASHPGTVLEHGAGLTCDGDRTRCSNNATQDRWPVALRAGRFHRCDPACWRNALQHQQGLTRP